MRNSYIFFIFLGILFFIFSCKDPIYTQCDNLCNKFNQCLKNYLEKNSISNMPANWQNKFYANCIDACMIYNIEIFECYKERIKEVQQQDECKIIVDCTMPVFLNQ
ncbi:MAG: hypothetical protein KatS3mg129_2250 [Leptospiraceae bacterium]|nr:MAG: hypothetical protein KatS3mg129_2250 [Leptospiraceae bacterium]